MGEFFDNIISSLGVNDVLDILIVAFIIYKLLGFIRETRAQQLAQGVLLLVVATLVSKACHLYTVHWILSGMLNVGIIALIIIFQPELRRLLENIGRSKFSNFSYTANDDEARGIIKEIVSAVYAMSKEKTGALIIIEKEVSLNDIAETGTVVNADITDQIIGNIFYEGAPLHDGAMIIRGDKVHAAGCVLPLTENKSLAKELGTRHRAAIGISENSDALVIVVSEESGIVSICENGKITRHIKNEVLQNTLTDVYFSQKKETIFDRVTKMVRGGKNAEE